MSLLTFAAPLFLVAALAAAIPIVLHMINRQRVKDLPFPTLQFLRISVEKTRRRKRIQDLFLMLLRVAVLLLIALGLAKPTLTNLSSLFGGGAYSAVAIVLDNSASMGMVDQDRPRFETAVGAAQQILSELKDGDLVGLYLPCGVPFPEQDKLDRSQDKARQMLAQAKVTYERADLGVKLHMARKALSESEAPNKAIYVISDMQTLSWEGFKKDDQEDASAAPPASPPAEGEAAPAKPALTEKEKKALQIPIVLVDCNRAPKPDCAVQKVVLETAVPVAGMPVKASAEVLNAASVPQQRFLELYVDGVKEQTSPVLNLDPDGRKVHDFSFTFARGGLHKCEIRLGGEDGSKLDDRRYFTMEVDQGIPVAIVKPQRHEISYLEDTFYLEQALSPTRSGSWALRVTPLAAGDLATANLGDYRVIYCVNLPAPSGDVADKLRTFVENGGSLVWVCGDNVNADAYNQMNQAAEGKLLPATLLDLRAPGPQDTRDSWKISFLDKQYPPLAQLVEPASLYESVLVYKHIRMDVGGANTATVLARLDDGEPLLVERKVEAGHVLMLGTSVHVNWSNLPLKTIFLPLFARLTFHLSGAEQVRHEALAGSPLVLRLDKQAGAVNIEVQPPTGEVIRKNTEPEEGGKGQVFRYTDAQEIGIYMMRVMDAARPAQIAFAVNVDPDEANPAKLDHDELQERFGTTPLVFADDPDDLSSTFKWLREGKSLWGAFLTAVLLVLVFETLIANIMTPKQDEALQQQLPAYMRRKKKVKVEVGG